MKRPTKENTPRDNREDKQMAKKAGMSMKQWEASAADRKHDAATKPAGKSRKG